MAEGVVEGSCTAVAELSIDELESQGRTAVSQALEWIRSQQRSDGRWDLGSSEADSVMELNDVGITALAIDSLLAAGDEPSRLAAQNALAWLASVQDEETGLFGPKRGWCYMSGHALATLTWIHANSQNLEGAARDVAQRAVDFITRARNPYQAWRFDYPPSGDNDSFVSSLMLRALAAAREAQLKIDPRAIEDGLAYLDKLTDPSTGHTGYQSLGQPVARLATKAQDFPREYSELNTALAILARLDLGVDPVQSNAVVAGSGLIARLAPRWEPDEGRIDGYYWMFGTEVLSRLGGVGWLRWRQDLLTALPPNQRSDGSWPLVDAWSGEPDGVHIACVYVRALQQAMAE